MSQADASGQDRPAKRQKTTGCDEINVENNVSLPREVWALIMEYLPYSDVKNVAATNRLFLHQVMPRVARVHIFSPQELHVSQARRLSGAERIYIFSLLKKKKNRHQQRRGGQEAANEGNEADAGGAAGDDANPNNNNNNRRPERAPHPNRPPTAAEWSLQYDLETKNRIVPYLSQFAKLQYVFLGAIAQWQEHTRSVWNGRTDLATERTLKRTRVSSGDRGAFEHGTLVQAFCGAFASGILPSSFSIDGLFHPNVSVCPNTMHLVISPNAVNSRHPSRTCLRCENIIKHFPSKWLAEARGDFLCVPIAQRIQTVIDRGHANLFKNPSFLSGLIRNSLTAITSNQNPEFVLLRMKNSHLHELRVLQEKQLIEPKKCNLESVFIKVCDKLRTRPRRLHFDGQNMTTLVDMGFGISEEVLNKMEISIDASSQGRQAVDPRNPLDIFHLLGNAEMNVEVVDAIEAGIGGMVDRMRNIFQNQMGDRANRMGNLPDRLFGQVFGPEGMGDGVAIGPVPVPFPLMFPFGPGPLPARNQEDGNGNDGDNPRRPVGGFAFRFGLR